jgi:hypothetical protein
VGVAGPGRRGLAATNGGEPIEGPLPGPRVLLGGARRRRLLPSHETLIPGAPICSSSSRPLLGRRLGSPRLAAGALCLRGTDRAPRALVRVGRSRRTSPGPEEVSQPRPTQARVVVALNEEVEEEEKDAATAAGSRPNSRSVITGLRSPIAQLRLGGCPGDIIPRVPPILFPFSVDSPLDARHWHSRLLLAGLSALQLI